MNWGTMSRDERDAAYNNTDAVKNSAALSAARQEASAVFRKKHPERLDIPYGPRERNKWDLFPAMVLMEAPGAIPPSDCASERVGAVVGRYKLLERLGEGGFGVVFLASSSAPSVGA